MEISFYYHCCKPPNSKLKMGRSSENEPFGCQDYAIRRYWTIMVLMVIQEGKIVLASRCYVPV
jgi:hypothetical protein